MPEEFNLMGILDLILQILGLTYDNFRAQLVERIGEENVARLETAFEFIRILVTEGIAAAWEKILEFGQDIIDGLIEGATDMVIEQIVRIGMQRLALLMAGPYGAVVEAVITTYNVVKTIIEKIDQILSFVEAVLDAVEPIALGNLENAANFVEAGLQRGLATLITFLAGFIGLGGIPTKIREVILRIQRPVQNAMGAVIDWVIARGRALFGMGGGDNDNEGGLDVSTTFNDNGGENHELDLREEGSGTDLYMASDTPRKATTRLDERIADENASDADKDHCRQAKVLIEQMMTWINSNREALQNSEHTDHSRVLAEAGAKIAAIKREIKDGNVDVSTGLPETSFSNGGGTGGFAGSMTADPLTSVGVTGSTPRGSATNDNWEALRIRMQGRRTWYARGHLLNHNIHGPGTLDNMAPITQNSNGAHLRRVETPIKNAVDSGMIVKYEVTASGTPGVRSDLIDQINDPENTDTPKVKAKKVAVVTAEQYVPLNFNCSWRFYDSQESYAANDAFTTGSTSIDTYEAGRTPNADAIQVRS